MNEDLKRELIIENYNNPVNKGLTNDKEYISIEKSNPSCIDHFKIEIKLKDNVNTINTSCKAKLINISNHLSNVPFVFSKNSHTEIRVSDIIHNLLNYNSKF